MYGRKEFYRPEPNYNKELPLLTSGDDKIILSVSSYEYVNKKGDNGTWIMISNQTNNFKIGGILSDTEAIELIKHLTNVLKQKRQRNEAK